MNIPDKPAGDWLVSRLTYESDDLRLEIRFEGGHLRLKASYAKASMEETFTSVDEARQWLGAVLGNERSRDIMAGWTEISYRRKDA